ncbi:bifunctional DNA primase/polymerase [Streptomyces sp. NPDC008121]|uniref:bifunctional DNA primase/polymerase n=1 Tax=Streptomyces sp. NPDC008121 TaxID=3364809 RepID=UPI0036ED8F0A
MRVQSEHHPPRAKTSRASLDTALWLAQHGYPVLPLIPGGKTPAANCSACRGNDHPPHNCPCHTRRGWCHGFHAATTSAETIKSWWQAKPVFGVGVACGPARLIVIDVDAHAQTLPRRDRLLPGIFMHPAVDLTGLNSGFDTLALLAAVRNRPNPCQDTTTLRVRTPSGGIHIWYRAPRHGPRFRSSSGSSAKTALGWQVDIRAVNGYIVAPGTKTSAGAYTALPGARLPAPIPLWLIAELTRTGHALHSPHQPAAGVPPLRSRVGAPIPGEGRQILSSLLEEVRACKVSPNSMAFTEKLNRAAFTAGGLMRAGYLSEADCRSLLLQAAAQARPQQPRRSALVIESGLRAGSLRPIHPKERI